MLEGGENEHVICKLIQGAKSTSRSNEGDVGAAFAKNVLEHELHLHMLCAHWLLIQGAKSTSRSNEAAFANNLLNMSCICTCYVHIGC